MQKTRYRWTWWAPLLLLTGILVGCERAATPAATAGPAPAAPASPPTEPQATCADSAIRLLDGGAGIHGAIVADTLHSIPYIFEAPIPVLQNNWPKHTNLTAGGRAYLGGELWFRDHESIYVSGGSGRYPPRNPQHLADAADVFRSYGYAVTSLGWDTDNNRAERYIKP